MNEFFAKLNQHPTTQQAKELASEGFSWLESKLGRVGARVTEGVLVVLVGIAIWIIGNGLGLGAWGFKLGALPAIAYGGYGLFQRHKIRYGIIALAGIGVLFGILIMVLAAIILLVSRRAIRGDRAK